MIFVFVVPTSSYSSFLVLIVSNSLTLATAFIITAIISSLMTVLVTKKCCSKKSDRPRSFVQHDQLPLDASYVYITESSMDFQTTANPAYAKPEKSIINN